MNDSELAGGYLLCREAYLRLRAIGDYRTGRMELLRLSMVTVIIGVFLIAATFASRFVTGDGALLFRAAGLFCVVSGAINFRWLLPASLLVEAVYVGIAGLAIGGLPFLVGAWKHVRPDLMPELLFAGILLLAWSAFGFVRFRRAFALLAGHPKPSEESWLAAIVEQVEAADPDRHRDAVAFITEEFGSQIYQWRGRFFGETAVFLKQPGGGMLVADRPEIKLINRGKRWLTRDHKVRIRIGRRRLRGMISAESLSNFRNWLTQQPARTE